MSVGGVLKGATKAVGLYGDVKSGAEAVGALANGKYGKAAAIGAGMAAGALTDSACGTVAVAAGAPTGGVGGALVGAACFKIGDYVGDKVEEEGMDAWG
ncbi:hypothetical protein GCM10010329_11440 [Streptomyces spiroverticillatus]|uniref:Uncharacterized protein n=1 Tax=Streptomyces finlayi TaxID=67296 RepID=A0A918WXG8_9ACTN|nr:hypothetical protein GCM10010329_11440 [Streptomyces spiroverticillatus]GHC93052.1 hypothetical protein GCM10010334_29660 [Streptomyces finlayi]